MPKASALEHEREFYRKVYDETENSVQVAAATGVVVLQIKVASYEAIQHLLIDKMVELDMLIEERDNRNKK